MSLSYKKITYYQRFLTQKRRCSLFPTLEGWGLAAKILMKKLMVWLFPILLIVMTSLIGCVPLSVKISNADRKVELAELIQINKDLIRENQNNFLMYYNEKLEKLNNPLNIILK